MSCKYTVPRNLGSSTMWKLLGYIDLLKTNPAQTCTNRVIFPPGTCLWFLPNISLGIPGVSRTVKKLMANMGVNIPYHTPSTSRKTAKTSVTFIMSIIFYRCIGLTADSIINHRNLAKVCTNVHGSFQIARTILKQEVDPPCQLQLSLVAQPLSIATFLICLAIQFG